MKTTAELVKQLREDIIEFEDVLSDPHAVPHLRAEIRARVQASIDALARVDEER